MPVQHKLRILADGLEHKRIDIGIGTVHVDELRMVLADELAQGCEIAKSHVLMHH